MMLLLYEAIPVLGSIVGQLLNGIINIGPSQSMLLGVAVVSLLVLLLYRLWLRKEPFKGVVSITGRGAGEAFRLAAVVFAVDAIGIAAVIAFDYGIDNLVLPGASTFFVALCAGVFEETAFRAIPLSILMKNRPTEKRIILAVFLTAFIFGAAHLMNIRMGAPVGMTVYVSFQAMIIAALFAAFYLRTGSIILPMAFHFMHDILSQTIPSQSTGVAMQHTVGMGTIIPDIVIMTCELIATVYLLRPSVMEEIKETWRDKWSEESE